MDLDVNSVFRNGKLASPLVRRQEHIELSGNLWEKNMVFKALPPNVKGGLCLMTHEDFDNAGINTSVYEDAHVRCSMARA